MLEGLRAIRAMQADIAQEAATRAADQDEGDK
jgi:hypothetical protein